MWLCACQSTLLKIEGGPGEIQPNAMRLLWLHYYDVGSLEQNNTDLHGGIRRFVSMLSTELHTTPFIVSMQDTERSLGRICLLCTSTQ